MKNYSDLPVTNLKLDIQLEFDGSPDCSLLIDPNATARQDFYPGTVKSVNRTYYLDLLTPFSISIILRNKIDNNTGIIIKKILVDDIEIMPRFNYLGNYINENNTNTPTSYLGVNGKWTLTINCPFYQWLHQATAQGWLIG